MGLIGVVARAKRAGLIDRAKPVLDELGRDAFVTRRRIGREARPTSLSRVALGQLAGDLCHLDALGHAEEPQNLDLYPGHVELVPSQAVPRRSRMRVVIVVPALDRKSVV